MVSTDAQLADMLKEEKSKSSETIILERCILALVVSALLFGNFMTLLVLVLNPRQMQTVPNMFVASLAVSDLNTGIFSNLLSFYSGIVSKWPFGDATYVQIPRLVITNYGINHGSHNGIDGGEQIFTNSQTSKVPTTFYQDEDQDNDCCAMDLLRVPFFIVHAW